ncbi:MAG: type II toxin-antitoxin system VapC family toxin [Nitrospirae bacterium]|nr:type II toxin-antitoxin system VapC family toxin [Nitrospirota bacterium]
MNGNKFLLDTNILLYIAGKRIDTTSLPQGEFFISFVTELEILSYPSRTTQEEIRLRKLLAEMPVIDATREIKDSAIALRKQYRLKLPDALIAATAQTLNATPITNDKGFDTIKEITTLAIKA